MIMSLSLLSVGVSDLMDQLSASSFTHIDPFFSFNGRNYKGVCGSGGGGRERGRGEGGVQSGGDAEFFGSEAVSHKPCLSSFHGDVMISK